MSGLPHPTLPHFVQRIQRRLDDGDLLLVCGFGVSLLLVVVWAAALAVARMPWLVLPIAVLVGAVVLARAYARTARNRPGRGGRPRA